MRPQHPAAASALALFGLLSLPATLWGHGAAPAIRGNVATRFGTAALDVVTSGLGNARFCEGNGAGNLNFCSSFNNSSDNFQIAVGDIDQDGWADVVIAGRVAGAEQVCINNQDGGFDCTTFNATDNSLGVALGDLNGDGNLDVVIANFGSAERRCLNDGSGGLASCVDFNTTDGSTAIALGDIDGDGDLDAVISNNNAAYDRLCRNNGSGDFTACANFNTLDTGVAVALGDLDRDGDLDMVLADTTAALDRLCFNDGSGNFSCSGFNAMDNSRSLALGDLNGDNALDIVIANFADAEQVCLNDGSGQFTTCTTFNTVDISYAVSLGDLDGDGDLDVVLGNGGLNDDQAEVSCLNDGAGGFTDCSTFNVADKSFGVALGQFDNDFFTDVTPEFVGGVSTSNFSLTLASMVTGYKPAGLVALYAFDAEYCNTGSNDLLALRTRTVRLSRGNTLRLEDYVLPADAGNFMSAPEWREGGIGAELAVPQTGAYADGVLASGECVTLRYQFNLFSLSKYRFAVRLFGDSATPESQALLVQIGSVQDTRPIIAPLELDLGSLTETVSTAPIATLPGGNAPTPVIPTLSFPAGTSNLPSRR